MPCYIAEHDGRIYNKMNERNFFGGKWSNVHCYNMDYNKLHEKIGQTELISLEHADYCGSCNPQNLMAFEEKFTKGFYVNGAYIRLTFSGRAGKKGLDRPKYVEKIQEDFKNIGRKTGWCITFDWDWGKDLLIEDGVFTSQVQSAFIYKNMYNFLIFAKRTPPHQYIGNKVTKYFGGKPYDGRITFIDDEYYHVLYDDGDEEALSGLMDWRAKGV